MTDLNLSARIAALTPERHVVESSDGVTVAAYDFGGTGPTVLFSHATGFHARVWDPIIALLSDSARAVSIDLRGHGDSTVPDGVGYAWRGMADDTLAVVDHLNLGDGLLGVGHSMGGATLMLAESMRPGLLARSWLFEPIAVPKDFPQDETTLMEGARKRREVFPTRDAAFERYIRRAPFSACDPIAVRRYVDYGFRDLGDEVVLKCRGEVEAQVFENSLNDVFERLDQIKTEVVVVGSTDGGLPAQIAPRIADRLPNGRFVLGDGWNHFAPFAQIEAVAASIRTALLS